MFRTPIPYISTDFLVSRIYYVTFVYDLKYYVPNLSSFLRKFTMRLLRLLWHEGLLECSTGYSRRFCWPVRSIYLGTSLAFSTIGYTLLDEYLVNPYPYPRLNRSRQFKLWTFAKMVNVSSSLPPRSDHCAHLQRSFKHALPRMKPLLRIS